MPDITEPLVLAHGSHKKGSGKGCAMNVISWENGDVEITDFPACSDRFLALLVQRVNDLLASRDTGYLSAEDSLTALALGHATVGTSDHGLADMELRKVYARVVLSRAAHRAPWSMRLHAIDQWIAGNISIASLADYSTGMSYYAFQVDPDQQFLAAVLTGDARDMGRAIFRYLPPTKPAISGISNFTQYLEHDLGIVREDPQAAAAMVAEAIRDFHALTGTAPQRVQPEVVECAVRSMREVVPA